MIKVSIICTDPLHPVNKYLERWISEQSIDLQIAIYRDVTELLGGDFLFLISCHQFINKEIRSKYRYSLVLHASKLPFGRGMSPHVWQILEGASSITVSLLNAEDKIDSGEIWHQNTISLEGTELYDEVDTRLFQAEIFLIEWALKNCDKSIPKKQVGVGTYYPKRTPEDSKIDPTKPLTEVFDLLRIANPERYPAYFEFRGQTYLLKIEKKKS